MSRSNPGYQARHYSRYYGSGDGVKLLIKSKISESPDRIRYKAKVISVGTRRSRGEIWLTMIRHDRRELVHCGDTLYTRKALNEIKPPLNPGGFDFKSYAAKKRMIHQLYLREGEYLCRPGREKGVGSLSVSINRKLQGSLGGIFKDIETLAVSKALLLGARHEISPELMNHFKGAGAAHILAISGLHVGIILAILMQLTRPLLYLKAGKQISRVLVLISLWCYALITGMSVSVLRAVSMFSLLSMASWVKRESSLFRNLVLSAFVLLLAHPMYAFDVGFQLSYAALAGIALTTPLMRKIRPRKTRVGNYFLQLVFISCSAQLGVMPLTMMYFNQFSGLFLLSSLVLLPFLGTTLGLGYALLAFSLVADLPYFLSSLYEKWIGLLNESVMLIGQTEELIFRDLYFPVSFCILTYLAMAALYFGCVLKKPVLIVACGSLVICMQLLWLEQRSDTLKGEELIAFQLKRESLMLKRRGAELKEFYRTASERESKTLIEEYARTFPGAHSLAGPGDGRANRQRLFYIDSFLVFILDSPHALSKLSFKPNVVLLVGSPQINLDRLLSGIRPEVVVADGSNYPSYIRRWRETCSTSGVRFHSTYDQGAFRFPNRN